MTIQINGTSGISGVDGSAATPALQGTDSNTGISFGTDEVNINTGGTTAVTVDSSQRVGIGTTSASELLSVNGNLWLGNGGGSGGSEMLRIWNDSGVERIHASNNPSALAFGIGGSSSAYERVRIDSSGRLLVGTTTAASNYRVGTTSFTPKVQAEGADVSPLAIQRTDGPPHLFIATGVNVASGGDIGKISFNAKDGTNLVQAATIGAECDGTPGANDMPGRLVFSTTADGSSSPTERMRITNGGYVLIGKTDASVASTGIILQKTGESFFTLPYSTSGVNTLHVYSSSLSAYRFYVGMDGTVNATNTTISAISDQRLKENVRDLETGLAEILSLQPRRFDWKTGKGKNIQNDQGFIAQEFEQVFPEMIGQWIDPAPEGEEPYKSVRADLIPVLVKAIQEQQAIINGLETRLAALEAQ